MLLDILYCIKFLRSTDFEALKMWCAQSGTAKPQRLHHVSYKNRNYSEQTVFSFPRVVKNADAICSSNIANAFLIWKNLEAWVSGKIISRSFATWSYSIPFLFKKSTQAGLDRLRLVSAQFYVIMIGNSFQSYEHVVQFCGKSFPVSPLFGTAHSLQKTVCELAVGIVSSILSSHFLHKRKPSLPCKIACGKKSAHILSKNKNCPHLRTS